MLFRSAQRSLRELDLVALMVDGIGFGEHMLVVALGIDSSGKKHALAIREGSTENASLCRSLLSDLVARGVPANRALLVVIDGGTGLRGAVKTGVRRVRSDPALPSAQEEKRVGPSPRPRSASHGGGAERGVRAR